VVIAVESDEEKSLDMSAHSSELIVQLKAAQSVRHCYLITNR